MKIGILFDLDGTLLNTLEDLTDATNYTLRHFGCPERTITEMRQILGNGALRQMVREQGWESFGIPAGVGGRYSVLSPVGLLPMAVAGIDIMEVLNGAMDAMPDFCITVGFDEIFAAKKVRLACFRDWHRAVVRQACYGEESGHFPVTLLQSHPDARITISEFVAALG